MIPIARVALLRLVRDRSNLFFVVVLPLLLVLLIGLQFGAGPPDVTLLVAGPPGALRDGVVEALEADDVVVLLDDDEAAAARAVDEREVGTGIAVPGPAATAPTTVTVHTTSDGSDAAAVRTLVEGAVATASVPLRAGLALEGLDVPVDPAVLDVDVTAVELRTVAVDGASGGGLGEEFAGLGQFDFGASSMLLLFVFITALTSSAGVVQARRWGIVDRVVAGPTSPTRVVSGLALGQFVVALAQALLIVVATALLFDVDWGDPLASSAVVVAFSAVAAAGGLLLGAWLDSEERVGGVAPPIALVLAAVGGSMVPLELFPEWLLGVARATPHAWGNLAFAEILRRDAGVADVVPNLLVLAAQALVLGGAATLLLRRRISRV